MKILLVDDDRSYCRMLRLWLEPSKHHDTISVCHNRHELEQHLPEFADVDVAIVDRNISGADDGPEIAQEIKQVCNCLVIGLSAYPGKRYGDRYLSKGDYQKVVELMEEIRREKNAA